jgi:hypothetical protein
MKDDFAATLDQIIWVCDPERGCFLYWFEDLVGRLDPG